MASKRREPTVQCDLVAWFVNGLPSEVAFYVRLQQPTTLDDAIKIALAWEVAWLEIFFSRRRYCYADKWWRGIH